MSVPEASMNEHRNFMSRQYQIRSAGKFLSVEAKTEPGTMEESANGKLGRGIFRANPTHQN
jgi:hypothetical protein